MKFAQVFLVVMGLLALPASLPAAIPPAKPNPLAGPVKAVHDAEANLEAAKKQMLVIRHRVELVFSARPDWKAAKATLDKAKTDYEQGMKKISLDLENNPEYKAQEVKRDKAQAILDAESHPAPVNNGDDPVKLTDEQINAASKDRTDAGIAIRDMQKSAADNDPKLVDLKQKIADAQTTWEALQAQVDEAMKLDPGYPQAKQAVDQAEAAVTQARTALAQAAQQQRLAEEQQLKSRSGRR